MLIKNYRVEKLDPKFRQIPLAATVFDSEEMYTSVVEAMSKTGFWGAVRSLCLDASMHNLIELVRMLGMQIMPRIAPIISKKQQIMASF